MHAVPGPVQSLEVMSVSFTLVKLLWTQPMELNGDLKSYMLLVHSADSGNMLVRRIDKINKQFRQYIVTDLQPGIKYNFTLMAATGAGMGQPTSIIRSTRSLGELCCGSWHACLS